MFSIIMDKVKKFMQVKRNKTIVTIGLIVVCFFAFNLGGLLGKVFTSITSIFSDDNKEVKQVIFKSDGYDSEEDGSFKVVKQADWTSTSTAQITFTVDSIMEADIIKKDIIVVLDTSASMKGSRLNSINNELKELFNAVLEDEGNKFALIEFNDTAKVLTDFTDNKTTLNNLLDSIEPTGETNYNQALLRVGDIMSDYTKSSDREVKVIFITDGLPNVEHPNQNATYEQLKDDYPYLTVHAVPIGLYQAPELYRISDYQYYNYHSYQKILTQIAYSPVGYEIFEIVDYIDNTYFEIKDEKDIDVSIGSVNLTTENGVQKITWTVPSGTFKTGSSHTLKIDLELKDAYVKKEGLYSTNKETNIKIKLPEHDMIEMTTEETPKLKNPYTVTYVSNAPDGCSATISLEETHYAYETVSFTGTKLSCDGYKFAGWEVDLEEKTMVNSESFIMPTQDITIKGVWTKLDINKNMGGEVYEKLTLYNTIARQAVADNIASKYVTSATGVLFTTTSSDTNGKGVYTISSTLNDTYPIHYFRGDVENNHVIFGGFCWEIVRTTETGGVKLIYDGKPSNGTCKNTGTDSQIGTSKFNEAYLSISNSGYMYKSDTYHNRTGRYPNVTKNILTNNTSMAGTSYYYGTSATYSSGTYTLGSATSKAWNSNYSSLTGYYTCLNTSTSCTTVYYILGGHDTYAYLLPLSGGKTITTETMTLGTGITENSNGTYTLTGTTTIKKTDWYTNFANYQGYYVCSDYSSTTCATAYSIYSPSNYQIVGDSTANKFLYGNSFTYNSSTGTYTLTDTVSYWEWYKGNPGARHYTCLNTTGTCTTIYYAWSIYSLNQYITYLPITGGESIEDVLHKLLWADDVNETDSTVKTVIDNWYASNMTSYTTYLEDTVWCNDRGLWTLGGFDPDTTSWTNAWLYYAAVGRAASSFKPSVKCTNNLDKFTVSTANGNGELTYPVALIDSDEVMLAGGRWYVENESYYLNTGEYYWTLAPSYFSHDARVHDVCPGGRLYGHIVRYAWGVRPAISLKPGIGYTSGNGTEDNPYIIELS